MEMMLDTLATLIEQGCKEGTLLLRAEAACAKRALLNAPIRNLDVHQIAADLSSDFTPKQAFHRLDGKNRIPFQQGMTYNREQHFLKHEVRVFLEKMMPCAFGVASYSDLADALYDFEHRIEFDGKQWIATPIGWVKSGEGCTIIYIPADAGIDPNKILELAGICANLKKAQDEGKFVKYLKRLCAMYSHASWGTMLRMEENGEVAVFESEGHIRRIRMDSPLPDGLAIEGCGYCTPEFAQTQFGSNPDRPDGQWRVGDTGRWTITVGNRLIKGHFMCWYLSHVDVTVWDTKSQLSTGDVVFMGFMGPLHAGSLKLNIQPIVNFGLQGWAEEFGFMAMREIAEAVQSKDGLIRQFSSMFAGEINANQNGEHCESISRWRSALAIVNGFNPINEPFMIRDAYRSNRRDLLDFENGRVPVPEAEGIRAYYFMDPWTIDGSGFYQHSKRRLSGDCVYAPRLNPDEIVYVYRDPQTPVEYRRVINVAPPRALRMIDTNAMIVSVDIMMAFAAVQGGGDYDDCGNIVRGSLVEHFDHCRPAYPPKQDFVVTKSAITRWVEGNIFARAQKLHVPVWNLDKLQLLINDARKQDTSLGMIINWLMVSIALSLYKEHNLVDLAAQYRLADKPIDELEILAAIEWYEKEFVPFAEKDVAWNLEGALDQITQNGAKGDVDVNDLGSRVRAFWANCRVVPRWALYGGYKNRGRVPQGTLDNNPIVVDDPISISLERMKGKRQQLDDFVNGIQWLNLKPAPPEIQTYPCDEDMRDVYEHGVRTKAGIVTRAYDLWLEDNKAIREAQYDDDTAAYKAFLRVCDKHLRKLEMMPMERRLQFIAELERRTRKGAPHRDPRMLDSHPKPVADGYLNNPRFFQYRVMLYKQEGLTRTLRFVPLYPQSMKLYHEIVEVTVTDGVVCATATGKIIGLDLAIPNGAYTMQYGTVYLNQ